MDTIHMMLEMDGKDARAKISHKNTCPGPRKRPHQPYAKERSKEEANIIILEPHHTSCRSRNKVTTSVTLKCYRRILVRGPDVSENNSSVGVLIEN